MLKLIMLVFEMANKQGPLLLHAEYPLSTNVMFPN